jgi:hypothetical protein
MIDTYLPQVYLCVEQIGVRDYNNDVIALSIGGGFKRSSLRSIWYFTLGESPKRWMSYGHFRRTGGLYTHQN